MCSCGLLIALLLLKTVTSISGHYMIITKDFLKSLSDKFNEEIPFPLSTEFPLICKHAPSNCQPFLLQLHSTLAELFIPSVDPVQHLKLTNATIEVPNEPLTITTCFRYIPTGRGNDLYVLCLKNRTNWMLTTVTYKIRFTDSFELTAFQYGSGHGTPIDLDSPLIVTFSDSSDPVVLYVANVENGAELFIKDLNAGGDVYDRVSLPSDCIAPYELKHLHQLNALLKCSNRLLYLYDGSTMEFTKLPVQGIAMVERCANSTFIVMITIDGNIIFNKTASKLLMRISSHKIATPSFRLNAVHVSSFTCHWNGTYTNFYFAIPQNDNMMYYMSIPLEYAAKSSAAIEPHLILKLRSSNSLYSFTTAQSSIVGSAWVFQQFDSNHNKQETTLIDVDKEISDDRLTDGIAYVLSLESVLEHDDGKNPEDLSQGSNTQSKTPVLTIVISVVVVAALFFITTIGIVLYRRHPFNGQRIVQCVSDFASRNSQRLAAENMEMSTFANNQTETASVLTNANDADRSNDRHTTRNQSCQNIHVDNQSMIPNNQNVNVNMHDYQLNSTLITATSETAIQASDILSESVVPTSLLMPVGSRFNRSIHRNVSSGDRDDDTEM